MGRMSIISWTFGIIWDGRWQRITCIKRKRLAGSMEYSFKKGGGGGLMGHDILRLPKYHGKWLAEENKWWRVKQIYQKHCCTNPISGYKNLTSNYCKCTKGLFLCYEFYVTHVLDSDSY